MYKYRIYGLNVLSEIELNCYAAEFETEDVRTRVSSDEATARAWASEACAPDSLTVMGFPYNFGTVYICGSDCLIVHYNCQTGLDFIAHEMLELPFSILLMNRESFVLHGNTILYRNTGLVLVGDSGAGKSSLSAGFLKNGGSIIADDITRIIIDNDKGIAYPGFPSFKLWQNTADIFDIDLSNAKEVEYNKNKYMINKSDYLLNRETQVSAIVYLVPDACDAVRLEILSLKNAIQALLNNSYNVHWVLHTPFRNKYYEFIVDLCAHIPVYILFRPNNAFTVNEQIGLITEEIISKNNV